MKFIVISKSFNCVCKSQQQLYNLKMGHQTSAISRIHQMASKFSLVRQSVDEKFYLSRSTQEELVLVTRLSELHQPQLEASLSKRKQLKGNFIVQLLEYGRDSQAYCSDIAVMLLLFKQPFKSLRQEISNRQQLGEWFEQGEILMISYCVLAGLQEFRPMNQKYEVQVSQSTLFIDNKGNIILSDAEKYKEKVSRRSGLRKITGEQGKVLERTAILQLGLVLQRIIKNGIKQKYSQILINFIAALMKGQYQCYQEALKQLNSLKKQEKNHQLKRDTSRRNSLNHQSPNHQSNPANRNTPILELVKLTDSREPLSYMDCSNQLFTRGDRIKPMAKKKQNKYHLYKQQFQARKAEAFAQQHLTHQQSVWLQGNTLRLDEMSSIQRRTNKATEQDENELEKECDNSIFTEILNSCQIAQEPPHANIELFNQSRPERLKQLILNQKGIIYEQSGDQLESMASQRTQRFRNISFLE